jgi:hypothetical protein
MRPNNKTLGENTRSCQIRKINSNKSELGTIGLNKHTHSVKSNLRLKVKEIEISVGGGGGTHPQDIDSLLFHSPFDCENERKYDRGVNYRTRAHS